MAGWPRRANGRPGQSALNRSLTEPRLHLEKPGLVSRCRSLTHWHEDAPGSRMPGASSRSSAPPVPRSSAPRQGRCGARRGWVCNTLPRTRCARSPNPHARNKIWQGASRELSGKIRGAGSRPESTGSRTSTRAATRPSGSKASGATSLRSSATPPTSDGRSTSAGTRDGNRVRSELATGVMAPCSSFRGRWPTPVRRDWLRVVASRRAWISR